jgi:hypothetical protein
MENLEVTLEEIFNRYCPNQRQNLQVLKKIIRDFPIKSPFPNEIDYDGVPIHDVLGKEGVEKVLAELVMTRSYEEYKKEYSFLIEVRIAHEEKLRKSLIKQTLKTMGLSSDEIQDF